MGPIWPSSRSHAGELKSQLEERPPLQTARLLARVVSLEAARILI